MSSILIYGYGNPGRQDDGLGPTLVDALETWLATALAVIKSYLPAGT